jgi:hypothetical protein
MYVRNRAAGDMLRSAPPGIEEFLRQQHVTRQLSGLRQASCTRTDAWRRCKLHEKRLQSGLFSR